MKVRVVAYNDKIVIITEKPEEGIEDQWWPTGGSRMGCVLGDTKNKLGVSKEALELMKLVPVGRDAVGDIDWWKCDDGTYAFGWWGPIFRIIEPEVCQAAKKFLMNVAPEHYAGQYIEIPNELPQEIKDKVDNSNGVCWDEPVAIEPGSESRLTGKAEGS
jgi:hypothetical protein